jgi:putative redox protein
MNTRHAYVTQIVKNSVTFAGRADSGHWVTMDGPEAFGGSDAGVRPKELLLLGLAGCTGSDVASILAKQRVALDGFDIDVTAEETEEHPKVFTRLHLCYRLYGAGVTREAAERAVMLSLDTYCGVTAMFRKAMEITHEIIIEPLRR